MDRTGRGRRGDRRGAARDAPLSGFLPFLEHLPPGPLYGIILALAALENIVPPLPADTVSRWGPSSRAAGPSIPGRCSASPGEETSDPPPYALGRRYGRGFFQGRIGRKLLPPSVLAHIEDQYHRHGAYGIFLSRLLPVWRAVVPPFAGVAGLSAPRTLIPIALASGLWYGALTFLVVRLGTNLHAALAALGRVNRGLGAVALGLFIFLAVWIVRRLKR